MDKKDTIRLLRSLLISKKGTYEFGELLKDFKNETGCSLPTFGYKTTLDFLKSIPDTVEVVVSYQKIIVKPVDSSKSSHISSLVNRQNSRNFRRPNHRINSFKQQFNNKQYESTNVKVNDEIWNNNNNNKLHTVADKKNDEVKTTDSLLDLFIIPESNNDIFNGKPEFHHYEKKDSGFTQVTIGPKAGPKENVVECKIIKELDDIPKLDLKCFARIKQYIEVCVAVIWNPYIFTLQLRRFRINLINLICEMQLFYCENGDEYRIPDSALKSGLLCAAFCQINSDNIKWFRALILEHRYKNTIIVGLLDYGAITEIDIGNIRFLHRQFGRLPPQALSGHLANIQPFGSSAWSEESKERFLNLVYERDLVAGIVDLDYEGNWLSVALSYTGGPDVHINDTLVEENFARFYPCDSSSRICLPWSGNKGMHSLHDGIPRFWFHPVQLRLFKSSEYDEKKCSKPNPSGIFFSYSQSNARLKEMFVK